jgi:predicted Co/Zn/Cd cation transporter (cation efflux family)
MKIDSHTESRALKVSIFFGLFFALMGIIIAVITRSNALLLDGGYSFTSAIMAFVGLKIARLIHIQWSKRFHFGHYAFEPFFVALQGILILIAAFLALASSIESLIHGGRNVEVQVILWYLIFSIVACFLVTQYLKVRAKKLNSSLLLAESSAWMLDTALCIGAFLAFSLSIPLKHSQYSHFIPYIDPVITIIIILLIMIEPFKLIRSGVLDLLLAAPPPSKLAAMELKLGPIGISYGFKRIDIFASKAGRVLFITVSCVCPEHFTIGSIGTLDEITNTIRQAITEDGTLAEVQVLLTAKDGLNNEHSETSTFMPYL